MATLRIEIDISATWEKCSGGEKLNHERREMKRLLVRFHGDGAGSRKGRWLLGKRGLLVSPRRKELPTSVVLTVQ